MIAYQVEIYFDWTNKYMTFLIEKTSPIIIEDI